jgi:three-Cys-motif partner protein
LGGEAGRGGFLPATRRAGERYYVDLFAGSGQDRLRGTDRVIDGSPIVAIKAGPPAFTHLFWVDADPLNARSVQAHVRDYPTRGITVLSGDANEKVDDVLRVLPRRFPVFAFLDPRGAELRWRTVEKLARHKSAGQTKIELFILFAYNQGLVRLMPRDPALMVNEAALDRVMPSAPGWRTVYEKHTGGANPAEIRREMLDEYVQGLRDLGYRYVPPPRLIATPTNHPLYFMIFASDHQAGDSIMTWCLKNVRDTRIQASFLSYDERY